MIKIWRFYTDTPFVIYHQAYSSVKQIFLQCCLSVKQK